MALAYRVHRRWAGADAVAISTHPHLARELAQVAHDRLPAAVLEHLPYRNPLLLWPEPLPCAGPAGEDSELIAAYVHAIGANGRSMTDTDDPARTGYRFHIVTRSEHGLAAASANLVTTDGWYHPDRIVEQAVADFRRLADAGGTSRPVSPQHHAAALRSRLMPVLDAVGYLCSLGADLADQRRQPRPAASGKAGKTARRRGTGPEVTEIAMGWNLGPDLARDRYRHTDPATSPAASTSGESGARRPHPRRAHYGIRRTGPGGSIPRSVLIRATYVNRDRLGGADPTPTIVTT